MLDSLRMYLGYHIQAAIYSFNSLYNKPLTTLATTIVIAISLTLPALFWVMVTNFKQLPLDWQQNGHISLYLKVPLPLTVEQAVLTTIRSNTAVENAILKTGAEGLTQLQKQEGMQDIGKYLPDNSLPSVIEVTPGTSVNTPEKIETLFNQLKNLPEVDQAKIDIEWINRLHSILHFMKEIVKAIVAILVLAVILIVSNTLRLAVRNQYEEIKVLKLVGAPHSFIIRPFLYTGIWYGLLGAIFAILFINLFMLFIIKAAQQLIIMYHVDYSLFGLSVKQAYCIVLISILLGWIGARFSVNRQLTSIEPNN